MKKRILSIILSIVMLVGLLPTTALAADTHSNHCVCGAEHKSIGNYTTETSKNFEAWGNATSLPQSGSYYLTGDVEVNSVSIVGELNLCLNGHTITITYSLGAFVVGSGATLNICDCSTDQSGKIENPSASADYASILNTGGTVNVYSGTVSSSKYGINNNSGTVNVYGGIVKDIDGSNKYGIYNKGTVNVYGGTVSGSKYGIDNSSSGTVNVSGGTVNGSSNGIDNTNGSGKASVNVNGGIVDGGS